MKRTLEPRVLRKDVLTALSVLGMNRSSERFWAETPRRCNLRVYARVRDVRLESDRGPKSKTRGVELSLKEVESFLGTDAFEAVMEEAPASPSDEEFDNDSSDAPSDQGGDPDGHPSNTQLSVDEDIDPKHAGMSPRRRLHRKRKRDEEELYAKYDDYVDEIDKKASDREERRMWEMLGQQPREGLKPEELLSSKAAPFLGRPASDSRDWRDHVDYRSEWEQFGGPVLRGSFTHARRTVDKVSRKPNLPSPARTRKPTVAAVRMDYAHGGSSNEKIEEVDSIDSLVPPDHADNEADPPSPANGEDSDPQDSDISMEELPEESEDEELDDNLASPQANYDELDSAPGVSSGDSEISDEDNQDKEVGLTGRDAGAPL
ncbi:hypothetical protein LTR60_004573 [Cryomyces antarcticus]|nr:hypothetical protein LTR60_004573 [Cryomyces antarcticus]